MSSEATVFVLLVCCYGCNYPDESPRCVPDATVAGCFCPDGQSGTRRCSSDGLKEHGECVCMSMDVSTDAEELDTAGSTDPDSVESDVASDAESIDGSSPGSSR